MATKKDNIYGKIMEARLRFLESNPTKSGRNDFQKFSYYELDDIVPTATRICNEIGLYTEIDMGANTYGYATLTVINIDEPEEKTYYRIKMPEITGGNSNQQLQATGTAETYLRRYLYLLFLDIAQNDEVDSTNLAKKDKKPVNKPRSRPTSASKTTQPLTTNKRLTMKQKKEMGELDETLNKIIKEGPTNITMKQVLEKLQEMEESEEITGNKRLEIGKKIAAMQ